MTDRPVDQVAQTQQIAQNFNKKNTQEPITTLEEPQAGPSNADRIFDQDAQAQQIAENFNKKTTQEPITTLEELQAGPSNAVTQINFCRITMANLKALDDISLPNSNN